MRLALFTDTFAPQLNGVSRTLDRLVQETRSRGGAVRVFTVTDPRVERPGRGAVYRSRSVACPFYPELRIALPMHAAIMRALDEFRPDLVHAATPFGIGVAGWRAARAARVPFVTSYHTNFSAYARYYRLSVLAEPGWRYLRWFHNAGRRTFCPTHAVQHELRTRGFRRLAIWGRGVDLTRFAPAHRTRAVRLRLGVSDDTIVVAYVGRIAREKGLDALLTAIACLRHLRSDVVFAFAGDGPYLEHCRRAAAGRVAFLGRLEGEALGAFYASSDIAVFPSSTDTFGNVLLESMASGLPVVAADCPTSREVVGACGTFHAANDGAELANAILELVVNPARRRALGRAARLRAHQFSWRGVFDDLFGEYESVLREPERALDASARPVRSALVPQAPR
jgi:glycosyltransferase involved in cell wall biosynthesis